MAIIAGVAAAVGFLIDHNLVRILPDTANAGDLQAQQMAIDKQTASLAKHEAEDDRKFELRSDAAPVRDRVIVLETTMLQAVKILDKVDRKLDMQMTEGAELKANVYTLMRAYNIEPKLRP